MPFLTSSSVSQLLAAFRSSDPTPGGGSASALAGAVGASLLAMVAGLPKPRATTAEDVARLQAAGARCAGLAERLEALIDRDSAAYEMVVEAYKLPKATDEDKGLRRERIQEALRAAIDAPLEAMRACADAVEQGVVVAALGNANAASDVRVGLELLSAGLRGAQANVEINLGSLKDAAHVRHVQEEAGRLRQEAEAGVRAAAGRLEAPA
jgi:formiminotetrahydrofolate cyclodeaminase